MSGNTRQTLPYQPRWFGKAIAIDGIEQTLGAEFGTVFIDGLRNSVGKKQKRISLIQLDLIHRERRFGEHSQRESRKVQLAFHSILDEDRGQVARVDDLELSITAGFAQNQGC